MKDEVVATFPIEFGDREYILCIIKLIIVMLIKWSYRPPQYFIVELRMVKSYFEYVIAISFIQMLLSYLFPEPSPTKYHSNIGVLIIQK